MPSPEPTSQAVAADLGATASASPHTMVCMEVWGGNHAVDQGVVMPGLDVWLVSQPFEGDDVGGDVHYVSSCGTGRISRLVVADVSGHGEMVAGFARGLRTLMRRFVNYVDQTRFVEALNRGFLESDATGRFATSVAMTFFAPSRQLDICNAGHPRPLWWRAADRRWRVLTPAAVEEARVARPGAASSARAPSAANLPLGVLDETAYEQFGVKLERNDLVLVYTDALVEARGADGTLLGEEGLLAMIASIDASQPQRLIPAMLERLFVHRGGAAPDDDLTMLLMRHNGVGTQAPILARLGAQVRFLGLLARGLVPVGERQPIPWPELSATNVLGAFSRRVSEAWRGNVAR